MKSPKRSSANNRGFTLIEIIVVVALVGLIAAMGVWMGYDSLSRSSVHEERDLLVSLLTGQRAKALANVHQTKHGLRIDTILHTYTLFEGAPPGTNLRVVEGGDVVALSGTSEIVFEPLTANVPACATPCTITITEGTKTQTVDINAAGRIEW